MILIASLITNAPMEFARRTQVDALPTMTVRLSTNASVGLARRMKVYALIAWIASLILYVSMDFAQKKMNVLTTTIVRFVTDALAENAGWCGKAKLVEPEI